MLGIEDAYVATAYILCIASALLCLIYGVINWNRGQAEPKQEDIRWAAEEKKVEEEL